MRYLFILATVLFCLNSPSIANWQKINDVDYIWGPFTIYNLSLFSETGEYDDGLRPVMLTLKYSKPVDGRDFAISLARSWSNLGIMLPEQDKVVESLRKIMPNIKKGDLLSYIALHNRGYFVLNNTVIDTEFNQDFNNAVVSVWLDPRVEIGKALLSKTQKKQEMVKPSVAVTSEISEPHKEENQRIEQSESLQQGESLSHNFAKHSTEKGTDEMPVEKDNDKEPQTEIKTEKEEDKPTVIFPPNDLADLFPNCC